MGAAATAARIHVTQWLRENVLKVFRIVDDSPSMASMPSTRASLSWATESSCWSILSVLLILFSPVVSAAFSMPGQTNLKDLFADVGRIHNIDPYLLEAIADVESGGDSLSVSPKGALGLMQLMPATASDFSVFDPFNTAANLMGAADFLAYLRNRLANHLNLHDLPTLLAAYNAGPGAVEKYGGIPPYAETHKYVRRVIERYTNNLRSRSAVTPVLILGPKPYILRLTPGAHALQPEPVLITGNDSAVDHFVTIQQMHGYFLAAVGTSTAPWLRRSAVHKDADPSRP
jgi:hypothetical protein